MAEEGNPAGVRGRPTEARRDASRPLPDGVRQLPGALVAVNALAKLVARRGVSCSRRPDRGSRQRAADRAALDDGERLARLEAELRVQGEGAVVVSRLDETDPREALLGGTPQ